MREIIEWLLKVETLAGAFYKEASKRFEEDANFSEFFLQLATEEESHLHAMQGAVEHLQRTFSGNLMGCAAGVESIKIMEQPGFFDSWLARVDNFYKQIQTIFDEKTSPPSCRDLAVRLEFTWARANLSAIIMTLQREPTLN